MATEVSKLGLEIDFERLDAQVQNPLAYFKPVVGILYSNGKREIPNNAEFHPSALQQFVDIPFQDTLSDHSKHLLHSASLELLPRVNKDKHWQPLNVGETVTILVEAKELEDNPTYVIAETGAEYEIQAGTGCYWQDGDVFTTAAGWHEACLSEENKQALSELELYLIQKNRHHKVVKQGNWFCLCMSYDVSPQSECDHFVVGERLLLTATQDAPLYAFANDIKTKWLDTYGNNLGWLPVTIRRIN